MSLPKWTEERTEQLVSIVGSETPVSRATVTEASERLETTDRSVSSKLRKMGYEVETVSASRTKSFSDEQEAALVELVTSNSGEYTYKDIAANFAGGEFGAKAIQGKILSLDLTSHIKPAEKEVYQRTYTEAEEEKFVAMANEGKFLEEIAEALGRNINSVRGKALSLLRNELITEIPTQKNKVAKASDPFDGIDVGSMTVEQIAAEVGKTVRGVKSMLTRRGLSASDYDGAKKAAKNAEED